MLEVTKVWDDDELRLILCGDIDESANLMDLLGHIPGKVCINTRGVTRVNSVGLKIWVDFFARCKDAKIRIRYVDCSSALTNHLHSSILSGGGGTVESVMGPFVCTQCKNEFELSIRTPDIMSIKPQITGQKCPRCGALSTFDEIPQEYFRFLGG